MNFEQFVVLSKNYNLIPIYKIYHADLLSPALIYYKLKDITKNSFLFESVNSHGQLARYSFIGFNPSKTIIYEKKQLKVKVLNQETAVNTNFFDYISNELDKYKIPELDALPYFTGGYVGYNGFETFSDIEPIVNFTYKNITDIPDAIYCKYEFIIVYDHVKNQIIFINNCDITNSDDDLKTKYNNCINYILKVKNIIFSNKISKLNNFTYDKYIKSYLSDTDFCQIVEKAKKHIYDGDIYQIVLSNKFETKYNGDLFNLYRALRVINPSSYMHYIEFENNIKIVGASPEDLVKVKYDKATILPIAGTIKRGKTEEEDIEHEQILLNDKKELSEHIMLVDLARNDLGKVCKLDTVKVIENKKVHKFSHLMHIVSKVEGQVDENSSSIDVLKSAFPAGTVSGAPKISAINLINELEKIKRDIYAGGIGYIGFNKHIDICIAIRTFYAVNKRLFWQSGAGIVYDSIPEKELLETKIKAAALIEALKFAEVINENITN